MAITITVDSIDEISTKRLTAEGNPTYSGKVTFKIDAEVGVPAISIAFENKISLPAAISDALDSLEGFAEQLKEACTRERGQGGWNEIDFDSSDEE